MLSCNNVHTLGQLLATSLCARDITAGIINVVVFETQHIDAKFVAFALLVSTKSDVTSLLECVYIAISFTDCV